MITNHENDLLYLWNDGDPRPEPAQAQLGDVNAIFYLWNNGDPGPEPAQAQLGDINAIDGD
jgi:hypothetical protein